MLSNLISFDWQIDNQWEPELCAVESYGFNGIFQPQPRIGLEEKPDMKFLENCLISQASAGHLQVVLMKIKNFLISF